MSGRNGRFATRTAWIAVAMVCFSVSSALAGPPFQTDDPQPIDFRNYEFYAFTALSRTAVETDTVGPAAEFNWGALPNVHLHVIVPLAAIIVPLWAQKSFGPWTTYGGGGETFFSKAAGDRNYPFAGWLLQRDAGKKMTLGGEVFYHGAQGPSTESGQSATLIDVGGYYKFSDPGYQLLFCYGHNVAGQREQYAYVGLYWTWGRKGPEKDSDTAMNRFAPPERW